MASDEFVITASFRVHMGHLMSKGFYSSSVPYQPMKLIMPNLHLVETNLIMCLNELILKKTVTAEPTISVHNA